MRPGCRAWPARTCRCRCRSIRTGGARPSLEASVAASSLDLSQLVPPKGKQPSAAPARAHHLFSDARLPFDTLPALDTKADVRIERLVLPNRVALKALHAGVVLKNDHLELQPVMFNVAGGAVSGRATLDVTQGKATRLAISLEGKGISLEELAEEAGRAKQITGGRAGAFNDVMGERECHVYGGAQTACLARNRMRSRGTSVLDCTAIRQERHARQASSEVGKSVPRLSVPGPWLPPLSHSHQEA